MGQNQTQKESAHFFRRAPCFKQNPAGYPATFFNSLAAFVRTVPSTFGVWIRSLKAFAVIEGAKSHTQSASFSLDIRCTVYQFKAMNLTKRFPYIKYR